MKLVIDIPEEDFERCKKRFQRRIDIMGDAIANGTPLPKGHGDLIDRELALSGDGLLEFHRYDDYAKMRNYLKSIPTIIKADKVESEGGTQHED